MLVRRSLRIPSMLDALPRYPCGSAAAFTGSLRLLSLLVCVSIIARTHCAGSSPHVWPVHRLRSANVAAADFCRCIGSPLDVPSCLQHNDRSPKVRRVTFAPSTRRIYARQIRMTLGFRFIGPFAHLTFALYAVRVPRARALLSASFPPRIAATQLPFS